ncbi:hypothetical protein RPYSC3_47870 [Rhodopseudomonas palustris]|nr:hypothetical protein RPYSC3_47870 [Rhodopseudomonas palustris]
MLAKAPKLTHRVESSKAKPPKEFETFPVEHYSYSSMALFASDPFMFKIRYINGDSFETTSKATNVLGRALHTCMQAYFGGGNFATPMDEAEAIKCGYTAGVNFLTAFTDGLIEWMKTIPNRANLDERYAFAYYTYIKEMGYDVTKQTLLLCEKKLKHRVSVNGRLLPIPLVAKPDLVFEEDGEIVIDDHKFVAKWSNEDTIDGAKLIQAAVAYFVVAAELGRAPTKMRFHEMKIVKNEDKTLRQVKTFVINYAELPLLFDFFFRFYDDITNAMLGHQVFVPNIHAIFDKEVSLLAYIHRLDVTEEKAKQLKKAKVDTITDFLRRKIVRTKSLKQFEETIAKKFISAKTLNYSTMTTEERIKMKLGEHGIVVDFDSKVVGPTVTLYRYEPSVGVKMSRVETFAKDIELVTASTGVRILAPIPGTDLIGFEVPNKDRTFAGTAPHAQNLRIPVGVDIQGQTRYIELREAPHLLVAGTSGSGKSVTLNSILAAIGGTADLWLMDPKQVELSGIPCERYADSIMGIMRTLKDLTAVMEDRYTAMKKSGEKTWTGTPIVAVVDEYADLVMQSEEEVVHWEFCEKHKEVDRNGALTKIMTTKRRLRVKEQDIQDAIMACVGCVKHVYPPAAETVQRLAQKGRAAGIHMIVATQRPSVDVITGVIKANFPTRIALRTASATDSEVILGVKGAEKLCGKGDMLLMTSDSPDLVRLQGFNA